MEATRIAIVQVAPAFLDRAECLHIAVSAVVEAAAGGARLIVFPEAFIPGYPAWIWRLRPGGDMTLSERLHRALLENAVDLANDDLAPLREAARKHRVTVICGINERDGAFSRGTLYNTVVTLGADGSVLNRHRKLMPTNPERMVWGQGDATGLRSVDSPCGIARKGGCWVAGNGGAFHTLMSISASRTAADRKDTVRQVGLAIQKYGRLSRGR